MTRADDPALIIYTSGTTGQPKGALHAHRVLLGHLPGVEISHDFFPQAGDRIWTPADWAWIGGLLDVLMPALHHGVPVVARRFDKFTAEAAFELIRTYGIRNAFLPPTALKMMRAVADTGTALAGRDAQRRQRRRDGRARNCSPGGAEVLGVTINEFYGQTECNMIVSSCARDHGRGARRDGPTGAGARGAVLSTRTAAAAPTARRHDRRSAADPVMMLGYWADEEATRRKFLGDWLLTGRSGRARAGRAHPFHRPRR